ncbi:MAG: phasin family protein [Betaproteobacteria bacterium]|nr:MAG: phasin family protein [Betaproteobacteria bacterium]
MSTIMEQMTAAQKENMATTVALANIAASAAEKAMDLNVGAIKSAISTATDNSKAMAEAKDVQSMTALQSQLAQPAFDAMTAYMKDSYDIMSEAQSEFSKIVEAKMTEVNKIIVSSLDQAEKNAPAGSDMAVAAMKSAVAAANQTYDAISKASKQVQEVTSATVSTVSPTASKKKSAA